MSVAIFKLFLCCYYYASWKYFYSLLIVYSEPDFFNIINFFKKITSSVLHILFCFSCLQSTPAKTALTTPTTQGSASETAIISSQPPKKAPVKKISKEGPKKEKNLKVKMWARSLSTTYRVHKDTGVYVNVLELPSSRTVITTAGCFSCTHRCIQRCVCLCTCPPEVSTTTNRLARYTVCRGLKVP